MIMLLTSLVIIITGSLSVFFLVGKALTEYGPNDPGRIKEVQRNVYFDIGIAAAITIVFGFSTVTLTLYQYLTFKFLLLSLLNYDRMLEVNTD